MTILLSKSGEPLDDVVVLDSQDIDIPPQSEAVIAEIRSWLAPTQYEEDGSEYQKHLSSHLEGTGQWAIESPVFRQWRDSHDQGILWLRGVPGAGKSVHAANLIHHLSETGCPVLYFFFRHTIAANHRPEAALRDWLAQMLPFSPALQLELETRTPEPLESLTLSNLAELVKLAFKSVPRAYCVVDALDEMQQTALEPFLHIIDELGHLRPREIKLILTSRPVAVVERIVRNIRLLDVRLDKELVEPDITAYLWHRLGQSILLPESHTAVVDHVLKKADGLFLYAKLAMDTISHLEDDAEVKEALNNLPDDLTDIYSNILREHLQRTGVSFGFQFLIFQCVTHAIRPLRLLEIADCIAVTQPQHGNDSGKVKSLVRSACGPLLEILPDETVRIIHHSLTEYLMGLIEPRSTTELPFEILDPEKAHGQIALLCIIYLNLGGLARIKVQKDEYYKYTGEYNIQKDVYTPFTNYALQYWHIHIKKAAALGHDMKSINDQLHSLLVDGPQENTRKLGLYKDMQYTDKLASGQPPRKQSAALRLAILYELPSFVEHLLGRYGSEIGNYDPNIDYSPMVFAVDQGNEEILRSLIRHGADVHQCDTHGARPLHVAAGWGFRRSGNASMAKILLEAGADPEKDLGEDKRVKGANHSRSRDLFPAKMEAFTSNRETAAVFIPFLKDSIEVSNAFVWAMTRGKTDILEELMRHPDLNLNRKVSVYSGTFPMTPLFTACTVRGLSTIRMLLNAGADPNVPHSAGYPHTGNSLVKHSVPEIRDDSPGYNVLHALANPNGYSFQGPASRSTSDDVEAREKIRECFKLVLEAGADLQQTGPRGMSPLHEARDEFAARCLIEAGADVNAQNHDGKTPYHLLSHVDLLDSLLGNQDINAQASGTKQTFLMRTLDRAHLPTYDAPSYWTTKRREVEKAIKLIDLGAHVNVLDEDGRSALHYAAAIEDVPLKDLRVLWEKLMNAGADPNIQDKDGETPLHRLSLGSYCMFTTEYMSKAFLQIVRPNLEIVDKQGWTPVGNIVSGWGCGDWCMGTLKEFKKAGARFDITNKARKTLLHVRSRKLCKHDKDILRFLVREGVDPNAQDAEGNTIWHEAIPWLCSKTISSDVFECFSSLGSRLSVKDNHGGTPLHVMCSYSQREEQEGHGMADESSPSVLEYILGHSESQVNAVDNDGVTPLHIAATFSPFLVQKLVQAGADSTMCTSEGLNAFHLAARSRQPHVIGILVSRLQSQDDQDALIAAVNHKDVRDRAPLYYACASGEVESVRLLINAGASVDTSTYNASAWSGIADFEEEKRSADWSRWNDQKQRPFTEPSAGGVLISDKSRPRRRVPAGRQRVDTFRFPDEPIDEILELLISHGSASAETFLDEAISCALEKRFDYTVICLVHAREALSGDTPPEYQKAALECSKRRDTALRTGPQGDSPSLMYFIRMRNLQAATALLLENPLVDLLYSKKAGYGQDLIHLIQNGRASDLDTLLTPGVMEKLATIDEQHRSSQAASDEQSQRADKKNNDPSPAEDGVGAIWSGPTFARLLAAACLTWRPNVDMLKVLVDRKRIDLNSSQWSGSELDDEGFLKNQWIHPSLRVVMGDEPVLKWWDDGDMRSWSTGGTVLHSLVEMPQLELWHLHEGLPFLLSKGAKIDARNCQGKTPLHLCLDRIGKRGFSIELVRSFLEAGADPNAIDDNGRSCLAQAMKDTDVFDMLLSHGAGVSHSALKVAIKAKDLDLLRFLLSRAGVDPNTRKIGREVPESISSDGKVRYWKRRDPDGEDELYPIDYLICGISKNSKPSDGKGAPSVSEQMFDMLLEHGADLCAKYTHATVVHRLINNDGSSTYSYFNGANHYQERVLKHQSLDIEICDGDGRTPLLHACHIQNLTAINTLLERGADVRARDLDGNNALSLLVSAGRSHIKWSSEWGNAVSRIASLAPELLSELDSEGRAPLHRSLSLGDWDFKPEVVHALLDAGADVNAAISATGDTPLHILLGGSFDVDVQVDGTATVTGDRKRILDHFVSLGANFNARNHAGETPIFHYFRKGGIKPQVALNPAEIREKNMWSNTYSYEYNQWQRKRENAAAVKHEVVLWELLEGMSIEWCATSEDRRTLLHVVATDVEEEPAGRRPARFRWLMGKGIDALTEDAEHQSALDVAAALGLEDVLDMFKDK